MASVSGRAGARLDDLDGVAVERLLHAESSHDLQDAAGAMASSVPICDNRQRLVK